MLPFFCKINAEIFAYNENIIYLCSVKQESLFLNRKVVYYDLTKRKRGLILKIFRLLALIETDANQPIIRKIEGLLNELLNEIEN